MLTHQLPIESQFVRGMVDNLNAEIVLGEDATYRLVTLNANGTVGLEICTQVLYTDYDSLAVLQAR